ncbi:MAG: tetratricopeptide repeat protein [Thermodesulfobacteriota bacterium]|nr:tetratricopeptide repeat protein [Thermodesulfobacteriota bacterium]
MITSPFRFWIKLFVISVIVLMASNSNAMARVNPSRGTAYAYYLQAIMEKSSGRLSDASSCLKSALVHDPESIAILKDLAKVAVCIGNMQEAEQWAGQAIALETDNLEMKIVLARIYANEDRVAEALGLLEEVLSDEPDNQEALFLTGTIYAKAKQYPKAIEIMERAAMQEGRQSFMTHYYLGRICRDADDLSKAEEHLNEALRLNPHFIMAYMDLADVYRRQGKIDKSIDSCKALLAQKPDNLEARERLLMLLIEEKQVDEVILEFGWLKRSAQNYPAIGFSVAILCLQHKKHDNALSILKEMAHTYPDQGQILYYMAIAYEQKGDPDAAIEMLESIHMDDEFAVEARIRWAYLLKEKGQLDQAINLIEKSLKDRPNTKQWVLALANLYDAANRLHNSREILRNALDTTPDDKELLFHLAMVLDKLGQRDHAIECAKKAIEKGEDYVEALNFLGYTYAEEGINLDEAELLIKKALSMQPDDGYVTDSLGWVYFKKGKNDQAVLYLEKAQDLVPGDPVIAEHLGDAYMTNGTFDKALHVYQEALKLVKESKDKPRLRKKIQDAHKALSDMVDS